MNIKLKAFLITLVIISGFFGFITLAAFYPAMLFFVFLGVLFGLLYKLVLNSLQRDEE